MSPVHVFPVLLAVSPETMDYFVISPVLFFLGYFTRCLMYVNIYTYIIFVAILPENTYCRC